MNSDLNQILSKRVTVEGSLDLVTESVDWRFFIDVPDNGQILIISNGVDKFLHPLIMAVPPKSIIWALAKDNQGVKVKPSQSNGYLKTDLISPPFTGPIFDLIFFKDKIPDPKIILPLYELLRPAGSLVFGFNSPLWIFRRKQPSTFLKVITTLRSLARLLRELKILSPDILGIIPNFKNPYFIFPLKRHTMYFSLQRSMGHKFSIFILKLLTRPGMAVITKRLMPAYLVILNKIS